MADLGLAAAAVRDAESAIIEYQKAMRDFCLALPKQDYDAADRARLAALTAIDDFFDYSLLAYRNIRGCR